MEQRTADWYLARLGKFTGSRIYDLMGKGRGSAQFSQTAINYILRVAAERNVDLVQLEDPESMLSYVRLNNPSSRAIEWGIEHEPEAIMEYERLTGHIVHSTGFMQRKGISSFGSSPDGIVTTPVDHGCLEVKCPTPPNFARYLAFIHRPEDLKAVEPQYYFQCQAHMIVTGYEWCDFVAYNPYMSARMLIKRIPRDQQTIYQILDRVAEADEYINQLSLY